MKKLISDYEDEKVDALIRKAVKEEAENINAPDRIKEEIDEKIGRNHIMSKNVNKKIGIYILAGIILLVIIIAISVIATKRFRKVAKFPIQHLLMRMARSMLLLF